MQLPFTFNFLPVAAVALWVTLATAQTSGEQPDPREFADCPQVLTSSTLVSPCRCQAHPAGSVWGSDIYTSDSGICRAAVHAGVVDAETGGLISVMPGPRQESYSGTNRNGVRSESYGSWGPSFSVASFGGPDPMEGSVTIAGSGSSTTDAPAPEPVVREMDSASPVQTLADPDGEPDVVISGTLPDGNSGQTLQIILMRSNGAHFVSFPQPGCVFRLVQIEGRATDWQETLVSGENCPSPDRARIQHSDMRKFMFRRHGVLNGSSMIGGHLEASQEMVDAWCPDRFGCDLWNMELRPEPRREILDRGDSASDPVGSDAEMETADRGADGARGARPGAPTVDTLLSPDTGIGPAASDAGAVTGTKPSDRDPVPSETSTVAFDDEAPGIPLDTTTLAGLPTVADNPPPDDDYSFSIGGLVTRSGSKGGPQLASISDNGGSISIEYSDFGCSGNAIAIQDSPGQLHLREEFPQGLPCHDGIVRLEWTGGDSWKFSEYDLQGGQPRFTGRMQIFLNDSNPRRFAAFEAGAAEASSEIATRVEDPRSGLSLGEGPLGDILVTDVKPGSPAFTAGIRPGDLILMAANGAANPNGHILNINEEFNRNNTVEVLIQHPDGSEAMVVMLPPAETVLAPTALTADVSNSLVSEFLGSGRIPSGVDQFSQIKELAAAMGIAANSVSEAIADGRFVPDWRDLEAIFDSIPGEPCEVWYPKATVTMWPDPDVRENFSGYFRKDPQGTCQREKLKWDQDRIRIWNETFGPLPSSLKVKRWAYVQTILNYYKGREGEDGYAQKRCDFTSRAQTQYPSVQVRIECDGITPSEERNKKRNMVASQVADASQSSSFGATESQTSLRLQLFADGAFEALDTLAVGDMISMSPPAENLVNVIGAYDPNGLQPRYTPFIAMYIAARMEKIGACGDTLRPVKRSGGGVTQTRNLMGIVVGTSDTRWAQDFDVPAQFAPIVNAHKDAPFPGHPALFGWTWSKTRRLFDEPLANLACDSEERRRLEANMIAYASGEEPAYRR